jgi:serine/threonine protein kinase
VWITGGYFQVKLHLSLRDRDNMALHFQAPEINNNPNDSIATPKSDLYAIAMIFACIMRGRVFGERGNDLEQLHGASSSRQSLQVLQHRFIDETIDHMQIFYDEISRSLISSNIYTLIDFFRKCTEEDPKKRMKLMDCVFVLRKLKDLCVPVDTTIERRKLKTLL